jgi:thiamine biosynthesis lipoprotein
MNRRAQPWLGTLVDISADGGHQAIDAAFAAVALVHRLMSFHDPASDLSRLNRALPGDTVTVDAHTWHVLDLAEQVRIASDGSFNAACAPQLVAWACLPPPGAGAPVFEPSLAVYQCDANNTVRKLAPGWVDLGGIAKGYAVDLAIQVLSEAGVRHACVNAGGDLRVLGEQAWPVAVRDPAQPRRAHTQLWLRNEAMATSATYFSARRHEGASVCALVNGRSGAALADGRSVSVRAPLCAVADALTKVVMASDNPEHPALTRWAATSFIL